MKTRPLGIVLIAVGILMIAFTGFNFITTKKVAEIGPVNITKEKNHPVQWSPVIGFVLLVGGIVVVLKDKRVKA